MIKDICDVAYCNVTYGFIRKEEFNQTAWELILNLNLGIMIGDKFIIIFRKGYIAEKFIIGKADLIRIEEKDLDRMQVAFQDLHIAVEAITEVDINGYYTVRRLE